MPENVKAKGVHRPADNQKPVAGGGGGGTSGSPIGLLLLLTYA
jgi:hypothetical protein